MEKLKFNTWYCRNNTNQYEYKYIFNIKSKNGYYGISCTTYTDSIIVNTIFIFPDMSIENNTFRTSDRGTVPMFIEPDQIPDIANMSECNKIKIIISLFTAVGK